MFLLNTFCVQYPVGWARAERTYADHLDQKAATARARNDKEGASEMLPGLDRAWLRDAAGEHFASELREVAVDPRRWAK